MTISRLLLAITESVSVLPASAASTADFSFAYAFSSSISTINSRIAWVTPIRISIGCPIRLKKPAGKD